MSRSVEAYSADERVRRYDVDMDLLHPNRHKMVEIALEVLPFTREDRLRALDLGIGTGFLASRFLQEYPHSTLIGLDGSEAMLELASARLSDSRCGVKLIPARFEDAEEAIPEGERFDVIFSCHALHHLDSTAKGGLLRFAANRLTEGGWFINADLVASEFPEVEELIQGVRVEGIHARNGGRDPRFTDPFRIRVFLDDLERTEGDQPLSLAEDVRLLRESGIANASVFWQEYREAVYGGSRRSGR